MTIQYHLGFSVSLFVFIRFIIQSYIQTVFQMLIRHETQVFNYDDYLCKQIDVPMISSLLNMVHSNGSLMSHITYVAIGNI